MRVGIFKLLFYTICIFTMGSSNNVLMAQDTNSMIRVLNKLSVANDDFKSVLDSLITREEKCNHFQKSLIWIVSLIKSKEGDSLIHITMQSEISKTYKYLGYFYINETLFIVKGSTLHQRLFNDCKKEGEIKFKKKSFPYPEDYSLWVYSYKNNILNLMESYPLPCK